MSKKAIGIQVDEEVYEAWTQMVKDKGMVLGFALQKLLEKDIKEDKKDGQD